MSIRIRTSNTPSEEKIYLHLSEVVLPHH